MNRYVIVLIHYTDNKMNTYFVDTFGILYLFDDKKMTIHCNNRNINNVGTKYLRCNQNGGNALESLKNGNLTDLNSTRANAFNKDSDSSVMVVIAYCGILSLIVVTIGITAYYYNGRNQILKSTPLNKNVKKRTDIFTENFSTDENKSVISII